MKDPKVTELVKTLYKHIDDINKINKKLYKQGVTYSIQDSFDQEVDAKLLEIRHLHQRVEY
jgi:hypothetical protein